MDQLGISRFFIAGISMGGAAALHLAYTYPHRVQGLILLNTFASLKPGSLSEWRYFFRRGWRAFLRKPADQARLVAERVFPAPDQSVYRDLLVESIRSADPKVYRQAMLALARFNFTRRLAKIQTPTLVISGEEDTTIPLKNQRELAKRIPGTDHIVIPNAGHAVIADQPQLVNQNIIRFINRLSSIGQVSLPDG
jgi:pimeloyl-ACP methyl ester carboxylesterase